jgi:NAD(P)-dependent dehydrogenase (short-subunit alcohol dehydrogenase family)
MFLSGRTALVTGSSRNLGAVIAEHLAAQGAKVAVTYRQSEDAARELVARLGDGHVAVGGDLEDPAPLIAAARDALGRVDVLVHNAGPFAMTPFAEMSEAEWDTIWDVNVKAAQIATRLLAPGMRANGWGRIVLVSAGSMYLRNHSIYGLAKQALGFLAEDLALGQIAESADDIAEYDASFVERAIAHTPAGRLVTRAEVAELVAALCGPSFDMVTGATLPVDGGWRLQRF